MKSKIYRQYCQYILWIKNLNNSDNIGIFRDWDMTGASTENLLCLYINISAKVQTLRQSLVYWEALLRSLLRPALSWVSSVVKMSGQLGSAHSNILKWKNLKSEVSKAIEILISRHFGHPGHKQFLKKIGKGFWFFFKSKLTLLSIWLNSRAAR